MPHAGGGRPGGPFDHGRQQLKLLTDLEITTKAVERTAEAIGSSIAAHEQVEIQRAVQLDLPIVVGKPIPILYMQMDGTGIPVVKKEILGRKRKTDGQPAHPREVKLGCVFTRSGWDEEGYAIRDPDSTPALPGYPMPAARRRQQGTGMRVPSGARRVLTKAVGIIVRQVDQWRAPDLPRLAGLPDDYPQTAFA